MDRFHAIWSNSLNLAHRIPLNQPRRTRRLVTSWSGHEPILHLAKRDDLLVVAVAIRGGGNFNLRRLAVVCGVRRK